MKTLFLAPLLLGAASAVAQPVDGGSVPAETQVPAPSAPDAEHVALAERLVDRLWPVGTYRRITEDTMEATAEVMADMMSGAQHGNSKSERRAAHEARTGRPVSGSDPYSLDAAMVDPMHDEMAQMLTGMETRMRGAMARIYARRYSSAQLTELDAFFATPTGALYAMQSLTMMSEPEIIEAMRDASQSMMRELGAGARDGAMIDASALKAACDHGC